MRPPLRFLSYFETVEMGLVYLHRRQTRWQKKNALVYSSSNTITVPEKLLDRAWLVLSIVGKLRCLARNLFDNMSLTPHGDWLPLYIDSVTLGLKSYVSILPSLFGINWWSHSIV